MSEGEKFSAEEAQKLGYDPKIVEFFKKADPDLLALMWGNNSAHYTDVLQNKLSDEEVEKVFRSIVAMKPFGSVFKSTKLWTEYRAAQPHVED